MIDPIARGHEQQIVEYVNQRQADLQQARQEREAVWMDCLNAYSKKFDEVWVARAREERRSARYLPMIWDAVENITAQLMAMLFPNERWFQAIPGRRGGFIGMDDHDAPLIEHLLRTQHESMKFRGEFQKLVKWLVITGNCPWSMDWHREYAVDYPVYKAAMDQYMADYEAEMANWQMQMEQWQYNASMRQANNMMAVEMEMPPEKPSMVPPLPDQSVVYEGPCLRVGNPFHFVIDDQANDPVTAFRVNTTWRTKAYLKHLAAVDESGYSVYENLEEVQDLDRSHMDRYGRVNEIAATFGMEPPVKTAVRLDEAAGDFELALDNEPVLLRSYVAVVGNGRTLLRFEPNHLWSRQHHIQLATLIKVPGQIMGQGLAESALGLADSINVRHNQILDAAAVAINPETKVIDDGVFDPESTESGPGALHLVGDMNNLQPLQKNLSGLGLAFSEITMLQGLMEQMMRSANTAASFNQAKSATEIARNTSSMGASLQEIARTVEEDSLIPILKLQLQYTQQYMDEPVSARIVQDGLSTWRRISPEMTRRQWELRVVGSANQMLKEKRLQDLMMFLQLVSGNPLIVQSGMVDLQYLLRVVYEELGFMDGDKVFTQQMPGFPMGVEPQGAGIGSQPHRPEAGGGGNPGDPRFPGIATGDGVPPQVEALGPYTQAAQFGIMGG